MSFVSGQVSVGTSQVRPESASPLSRGGTEGKERPDQTKTGFSSPARAQSSGTDLQERRTSSELIASGRDALGNVRDFSAGKVQGRGSLLDISV